MCLIFQDKRDFRFNGDKAGVSGDVVLTSSVCGKIPKSAGIRKKP